MLVVSTLLNSQDEAPELVNPLIERFVAAYSAGGGGAAALAQVQASTARA